MTGLPPNDATLDEPVRLFVSYAYASGGTAVPVFGNAVLDIEFEPFTPEHVAGLQDTISVHTGRHSVILLHWQRVGSR